MATYRTGSAGTKITTNTGANITAGVTAAVGETVLCVAITRTASATITTLNGWTLIGTAAMTNGTAFLLGRDATSATNTWASPIMSASSQVQIQIMGVIQGVDFAGTTFNAGHLQTASGSTSPVTVPQLSGGVSGGIAISVIGMSRGTTVTWGTYTEDTDVNTGTGTTNSTLATAHTILASTGNTPSDSISLGTAGNYGIITVAIDPASTTTPVSGTDTLSSSITDSSAVAAGNARTDNPTISLTETSSVAVSIAASDTLSAGVTDTSSVNMQDVGAGSISLVGVTTFGGSAITTVTNDVPTGVAANDLLIWRVGAVLNTTPTTPTGWSVLRNSTGTAQCNHIYYRWATSSEPSSYSMTVATGRWTGDLAAYRGVDTSTPFDVTTPASDIGTTDFADTAITPVTTGAWVVRFVYASLGNGLDTTFTSSNMTIDGTSWSASGTATNAKGGMLSAPWTGGTFTANTGTTSAVTRTNSCTAALRPAPGSSGTPKAGSDSLAVSVTDTSALASSSDRADTLSASVSDTSALQSQSTRTDTASASVTDTAAIESQSTRTDTGSISVSDTSAVTAGNSRSDTLSASVSDTAALDSSSSRSDTASASVTETSAVETGNARSDTLSLTITDAANVTVSASASDTLSGAVTDSSSLASSSGLSDTLGASVTEATSVEAQNSRTDSLGASVADTAALEGQSTRTDALGGSVADTSAVQAENARSDALGISVSDVSAVQAQGAASESINASISDSASVQGLTSRTDTLSVSVTDSSSVTIISADVQFSDDFNRADTSSVTGLGANWIQSATKAYIANNAVVGRTSPTYAVWATDAGSGSSGLFSEMKYIGTNAQSPQTGVSVAMAGVTGTWYEFKANGVGSGMSIVQNTNGTKTTLASTATNIATNDIIRLTYIGGVLTGYINGVSVVTHTPSSPITGQYGVGFVTGTVSGSPLVTDDWSGGNPVAGTPVSGSDALYVSITDAAVVVPNIAVTDSLSASVSDASSVQVSSNRSDTLAASVSETSDLQSQSTRTDNLSVSLNDLATVVVNLTVSDDLAGTVSETASTNDTIVQKSVSDSINAAITENTTINVTLDTSDDVAVSVNETAAVRVDINVNDLLSLTSTESTQTAVLLSSSDSAVIGLVESTDLEVSLSVSDALFSTITDHATKHEPGETALWVWNGTDWVPGVLFTWDGSAWVQRTLLRWNGSAWE